MDDATRSQVRSRANERCEYCQLKSEDDPLPFHIEHIIPKKHRGSSELANLALACHQCNLHKGPNLSGLDPDTGKLIQLFNPREQKWLEHFRYTQGARITGLTDVGKTTIFVLDMNEESRVKLRLECGYYDGPLG